MKKNDWLFIACIFFYNFLFWKQDFGINVLLMNLVLIGALLLKDKTILQNRFWLFSAGAALASSFCFSWYGNFLSIFSNCVSILLVSSFVVNKKNSLLVAALLSVLSFLVSFCYMITDAI